MVPWSNTIFRNEMNCNETGKCTEATNLKQNVAFKHTKKKRRIKRSVKLLHS